MLEIVPAIDLRGGRCVRLVQGDYARETVFSEDPVAMALRWQGEGAARLHLVDLDGAREGRPVNAAAVRAIASAVQIPCQLGGGLRDESSIRGMLEDGGVSRVIVGTRAVTDPPWFQRMAERYPQRLVLGIDARNSYAATGGWLDVSQTSAMALAQRYAGLPLAAVIYTNIANDGMLSGVDPSTIEDLVAMAGLGLPVLASGGVTSSRDIENLAQAQRRAPMLAGAIVGRALYEGALTMAEALAAARRGAQNQ